MSTVFKQQLVSTAKALSNFLRPISKLVGHLHSCGKYSVMTKAYLFRLKFEPCSQVVVNEDSRFPASSKYSHDPVIVHREEMHLVSLVGAFRINRVRKWSGLVRYDDTIIDGY